MVKKILYLVLGALMLAGCSVSGGDSDDGGSSNGGGLGCLSCSKTISWTSYGNYTFNNAGPDTTAWDLVDDCGWDIHSGHTGGYGNTLQVASCSPNACSVETGNLSETDMVEDYCSTAAYIHSLPFRGSGNTESATVDDDEYDLLEMSNYSNSVWYYYEANRDGYLRIDTRGSSYDTIMAVFKGACTDPYEIAYDDDSASGLQSELIFPVNEFEDYYILIGSYGQSIGGGELVFNAEYSECDSRDEEGVVLVWAYQSFFAYRVRAGWTGSTREGIRIGSTLSEFLSAYPYFMEQIDGTYLYENGDVQVRQLAKINSSFFAQICIRFVLKNLKNIEIF